MSFQFMFLTASQPRPTATFACPAFSTTVDDGVLLSLGWVFEFALSFFRSKIGSGGAALVSSEMHTCLAGYKPTSCLDDVPDQPLFLNVVWTKSLAQPPQRSLPAVLAQDWDP